MATLAVEPLHSPSFSHENSIPPGTEEAQLQRLEALAAEVLHSGIPQLQPEQVSSADGRKDGKDMCLKQIGVLGVLLEELRALQRVPDLFFPQRLRQRAQKLESELVKREQQVHAQLVSSVSEQEIFTQGLVREGRDGAAEPATLKEPCLLYQNLTKDLGLLEADAEVAITALWKEMHGLRSETRSFAEVETAHAAAALRRQHTGPPPSSVSLGPAANFESDNMDMAEAQRDVDVMEQILAESRKQAQCFEGANRCEECLVKVQQGLQQVRPRAEDSLRVLGSAMQEMDGRDAEIRKVAQDVEVAKSQLQVGLVSEWETVMGRTRDTAKWAGLLKEKAQHEEARCTELNNYRRKLNQRLVHTRNDLEQFKNHAHLIRKNPSAANF